MLELSNMVNNQHPRTLKTLRGCKLGFVNVSNSHQLSKKKEKKEKEEKKRKKSVI